MKSLISVTALAAIALSSGALADTTTTTTNAPATDTTVTSPATSTDGATVQMNDEQAKAWINKYVYSSDAKHIGEVAALKRDQSGGVLELHADIGGFLGLGETRVKIMPGQFKIVEDRVVLNVPAEQAKTLPVLPK